MSTRRPSWWRKRADTDFHAEIQAHLELEADRLAADDGIDPAEARLRARKAFGNVLAAEERFYESSRWMWLDQLRQDIRYACRTLWRSRTFVSTTVLTLAVALGLLTVLFAVFNAYVLRPFAIHDPYRVYQLAWQSPGGGGYAFTWRNYEELRDRHDLFDDVAAHRWQMVASTSKERQGRQLYAAFVSGNYFDTLRPHVRLGRALAAFDTATPGGAPVAVLSDQGWATLFDRDPHVLGRRVELNDRTFEVVGVLRPEFSGMDDTPLDVWLPLTMLPAVAGKDVFGAMQPPELTLFARLRTDVAPAQAAQALLPFMVRAATAQAAASASAAQAAAASDGDGRTLNARDVSADLRLRATPNPLTVDLIAMLSPVFAAFGLVLVAACANVSNVMLARAIARHREIGIRLSVGASRARIVRQLLTEALVISTLAGLAGLAFASLTLQAGRRLFFATLPASVAELARVVPLEIDYRVFLFALGVASVATLFCALMPALQATRLSLTDALRGQAAPGVRSGTLRNLLVAGQVTVSLVLLIAAATLSRNGVTLAATDLGFDTRGVFSINNRGDNDTLIPAAVQALASDPQSGVSDIAVTRRNPLFGRFETMAVQPATREETLTTMYAFVSPEYFRVLRIPILRGRTFRANEAETEAHVGIVSARGAQAFWPGMDPIGQVVRVVRPGAGAGAASSNNDSQTRPDLDGYSDIVIVGVAKDVTSGFVYDGHDPALVYLPTSRTGKHAGALLVRGRDTGALQRETLQRVLERVHRDRLVFETIALGEMKDVMLYPLRAASWIGALLGLIALALSVSGLYGVLTYVLGQRTREIGIRMALGATAAGVVRLMMHQSARIVLLGAALGVVFAFTTLKLLGALVSFRNVSLLDPWSFAIGLTLIAAAALFATYFPARRATRVDPSKTLRADA